MTKKILVVGAGQLGSRHLQALAAVDGDLEIGVIDPSQDSLKVAEERWKQVYDGTSEGKSVRFESRLVDFSEKGSEIDLAIVATSSNHRAVVVEELTQSFKVKNYVLEKILFNKEEDYSLASEKIKNSGASAWVNCCMREMPIYQKIAETCSGQSFSLQVTGSQYGLITNGIHYLDYAAQLAGDTHFQLNTSGLKPELVESRRKGFFELEGSLQASFKNGSSAQISCYSEGDAPVVVEVTTATNRFWVKESEGKCLHSSKDMNWSWEELDTPIPFQSQLTTNMVNSIFSTGSCHLTKLEESVQIHLNLLRPLKQFLKDNELQYQEGFYSFT